MPSITVVIPCLDDAPYLEACLGALAKQTHRPGEIVVVDNGSEDHTVDVARRFGARVVYEPIKGIPSATARGFDEAHMEILARIDADSIPEPDWVERVEAHFAADPELTVVTGTGTFYGSKRWVHRAGEIFYLGGFFWFFPSVLGHWPIFGSNCAIRRSAWERLEPRFQRENPRVHDDLHLSLLLEPDMKVVFDPALKVAVSARPLLNLRRIWRGAWWGYTTTRATMGKDSLRRRRKLRREFHKSINVPPRNTRPGSNSAPI